MCLIKKKHQHNIPLILTGMTRYPIVIVLNENSIKKKSAVHFIIVNLNSEVLNWLFVCIALQAYL